MCRAHFDLVLLPVRSVSLPLLRRGNVALVVQVLTGNQQQHTRRHLKRIARQRRCTTDKSICKIYFTFQPTPFSSLYTSTPLKGEVALISPYLFESSYIYTVRPITLEGKQSTQAEQSTRRTEREQTRAAAARPHPLKARERSPYPRSRSIFISPILAP